jgi:hypothetical protein
MFEYNEFVRQIKEGLILTHNIYDYKSSLDIEMHSMGIKYSLKIHSKFKYDLELFNVNNIKNEYLDNVININVNLFGYYPTYIWIVNKNGLKNDFKYDEKYLNNKYTYIKIRFEAKYDDGLYKNSLEVPEIAYHMTPQKNKERILKTGLYPKRFSRKSNHPERIYMFYHLNNYESLLKMLKTTDMLNGEQYEYMLLEVKLNNNNIIHTDPNYSDGFFTYDNIPHVNIKILKENL